MTCIRTARVFAVLCGLVGPGHAALAQDTTPRVQDKIAQSQPIDPRHAVPTGGVMRHSAFTSAAVPAATAGTQVVLHTFTSAPHGAYPASGVISDAQGNLYGTTNGSFSDIGGGGTDDAGVVFRIDRAGRETVLYSFKGGTDGRSPNGLVRDDAGNLFGTTSAGGTSGAGTVFRIDAAGNETVLYNFTGGNDGGSPSSVVRDASGRLYGVASAGGTAGAGVVFRIDTAGNETVLYNFTGGTDGAYPGAGIALDATGSLYGATQYGGNANGFAGAGVVFKVDRTGHETVLYTFTGGSDGAQPTGVTRDAKGTLYGATTDGGNASDNGVVFRLDPTGQQTVLYTFNGGNDGGSPTAGVTVDAGGNLYGTTGSGGAANAGVVFKVDPAGRESVLHTFARGSDGALPSTAGVILGPDCALYGTASFNGAGGQGTVYRVDLSGNTSVVYAFPGNDGGQYAYNVGLTLAPNGQLYGATFYGGEHGTGVVYELGPRGDETVHYTFSILTASGFGQPTGGVIRDARGNFYGTTFIGQASVGFGYGVVYKVDSTGRATVLHNFTGGADGGDPYGGVIEDGKGNLFGTAVEGGAFGAGVVFRIDAAGNESVLYSFTGGADGGSPLSGLIADSAGNLYGTTNAGGAAGAGVVFKVDPTGHETVLYTFTGGADGGSPLGGLVRDPAGNLYGATPGGGAAGAGVVYRIDPSGNETVLYTFSGGADGANPGWSALARDGAGTLYGTTISGGADQAGVVYKVDATGNETVLHAFTGQADGGSPYSGVILGNQGQLYGVTAFGGAANVGVVYEITP